MTNTELRRLAESLGSLEPWWTDWELVGRDIDIDDARYIAAASPDVIIALLDRCEALEKERDARPMITPEDAVYFVQACQQSGMDDEDDDSFRVTWEALRAHAAKGGE